MRVWERSLTSVPIGVYLDLIWVGTWLGIGSTKDFEDLLKKEWPDAAPDSEVQRPVSSQEVNYCREGVTGRYTGLWCPTSGQFKGGEQLPSRSDRTLKQCFSSVRSVIKMSRLGDRTLAVFGQLWSDASSHDSRGFWHLWSRPNSRWQRPVIATGASD